jgi:selenocysteine-specific elongation factor
VAPNRFFPPETIARLAAIAGVLAAAADEGGFAAGQFASETGIGRNLAIQVLEFLDRIGVTRRVGELRHVVRSVDDALG